MKIALIQLPLQSHDYVYSQENIPLAAGYLAAYLSCVHAPVQTFICPGRVMNLGGDALVMRWIEDVRPDVVGFSCYLWNVERSLHLCSMIRRRMENCTIVLGGPEVTADNDFLLGHGSFCFGVVGEGEQTFHELVRCLAGSRKDVRDVPGLIMREGRGTFSTAPRTYIGDLAAVASPYLSGAIGPSPRGTVFLETVRGCPMRCTYCYYHKSSPVVRSFPVERTAAEVAWARQRGVGELIVIDPCFARRPDIDALLCAFVMNRGASQRLSCELNAEDLTGALVDAMVRAGLAHVEIGLQSTHEKALKNVGRRFDRVRFMEGVRMLKSAGVRVMTDIMVGLPGDTLDDVKRSIDFVLDNGLCDDLSVYPLSVLPGTALRAHAGRLGIEYLREPPYLITSSATMSRHDIVEAFAYVEDVSNRDLFPVEMPLREGGSDRPSGGIVGRIVISERAGPAGVEPHAIGQALCIEVRDPGWMDRRDLRRMLQEVLSENPHTLVSWIVPEAMFSPERTPEWIGSVLGAARHPSDREYMSPVCPTRSCQLFLEGTTLQGGTYYVMIPLEDERPRPLWAGLPADAGPDEEDRVRERISSILGRRADMRFHDLQDDPREVPGPLLDTLVVH